MIQSASIFINSTTFLKFSTLLSQMSYHLTRTMATSSALPIIDLAPLHSNSGGNLAALDKLSQDFDTVFSSVGFAYLVNPPLSFSDKDVFALAQKFFSLSEAERWQLAKKSFNKDNENTYRGWFPPQPGAENLKEGYDVGSPYSTIAPPKTTDRIDLSEATPLPNDADFNSDLIMLYGQMQDLSTKILDLLAKALGSKDHFSSYLQDSLSTLRLLHYPPCENSKQELICTPHTDSGLLTLLHQDQTGGLEVLSQEGNWIEVPYVPGSIVVNIGDLMATISGGRWRATMHRVRRIQTQTPSGLAKGRFSIPFFFEPGERCLVEPVDQAGSGKGVLYGDHLRGKMATWIEFQDPATVEKPQMGIAEIQVI